MPAFPVLDEPLTDGTVALRPAAERDIPEILIAHQDDRELARALGLDRPPSGAELGRRTEHADAERAAGVAVWLTVLTSDDGARDECRGQVDVTEVDWDNRSAQLTIWIAPADRGQGLATAALALASRWLLTEAGLDRVQLLAEPANAPLIAAATAAGFREEGVLRGHGLDDRGRRDMAMLARIAEDL
jgi:RimJ/RimL family protein N-acetyltransferase